MSKKNAVLKFETLYEVEVRDKNGKLISKQIGKAHSWLKQFIQLFKGYLATRYTTSIGSGNVSINDDGGTSRSYPVHSTSSPPYTSRNQPSALGDVGDVAQGLIVGNGDTPNSLTTYALASKISHGSASGQLSYGAQTFEDVTNPSGMELRFRAIRTFTNNTGATVTVKEFGLLIRTDAIGDIVSSLLLAREVLASPSSIPDGATMTIRYIPKITVS